MKCGCESRRDQFSGSSGPRSPQGNPKAFGVNPSSVDGTPTRRTALRARLAPSAHQPSNNARGERISSLRPRPINPIGVFAGALGQKGRGVSVGKKLFYVLCIAWEYANPDTDSNSESRP